MIWILSIAIAYLLGSIPFGYLLVRIFRDEDVRSSARATLAPPTWPLRAKGSRVATLIPRCAQGFSAVIIAQHIGAHAGFPAAYEIALCRSRRSRRPLLPRLARFRGGKGVATALGVSRSGTDHNLLYLLAVFVVVVLSRATSL